MRNARETEGYSRKNMLFILNHLSNDEPFMENHTYTFLIIKTRILI